MVTLNCNSELCVDGRRSYTLRRVYSVDDVQKLGDWKRLNINQPYGTGFSSLQTGHHLGSGIKKKKIQAVNQYCQSKFVPAKSEVEVVGVEKKYSKLQGVIINFCTCTSGSSRIPYASGTGSTCAKNL